MDLLNNAKPILQTFVVKNDLKICQLALSAALRHAYFS